MKKTPVIVNRQVEELIPYIRNSRTHSDAQVAQVAASIREFGWTNPVLIDGESGIIAGHCRVMAARKLDMAEVPCIELAGMTDTQKRAYIIADNQLAIKGEWSDELLQVELEALHAADFDMALLGFDAGELAVAMGFEDGWESDIEKIDRAGENVDGFDSKIVIKCKPENKDCLLIELKKAITTFGIEGVSID